MNNFPQKKKQQIIQNDHKKNLIRQNDIKREGSIFKQEECQFGILKIILF